MKDNITYVGLDVHKNSSNVALAASEAVFCKLKGNFVLFVSLNPYPFFTV